MERPRHRAARLTALLPGLAVVAAATALAYAVAAVWPAVNATTAGVVLGVLLVQLRLAPPRPAPGHADRRPSACCASPSSCSVCSCLSLAQLGLPGPGLGCGRRRGHGPGGHLHRNPAARARAGRGAGPVRLLIATGFSICGASAVAAMEPVADGDEEDTSVAIALVTLCGSLAIFLLPVLRGPLQPGPRPRSAAGSAPACTTWDRPSPRPAASPELLPPQRWWSSSAAWSCSPPWSPAWRSYGTRRLRSRRC